MSLTYFDLMISILIAIRNHVNYKAFDHVNTSFLKVYLLVTYLFVFIFIA